MQGTHGGFAPFRRSAVVGASALALVASGVVMTGCGAPSSHVSTRTTPAVSSCQLLTVSTIKQVTGTQLSKGVPADKAGGWSICNWENPRAHQAVQMQVRLGNGRQDFDQRRQDLAKYGLGTPRALTVTGADAAYDIAGQGVVGVLVDQTFVQVATIGSAFDTHEHVALAAAVVQELKK